MLAQRRHLAKMLTSRQLTDFNLLTCAISHEDIHLAIFNNIESFSQPTLADNLLPGCEDPAIVTLGNHSTIVVRYWRQSLQLDGLRPLFDDPAQFLTQVA